MGSLFSKKSNNSTSTASSSVYNDSRSVVDAGGGIAGNGNYWDQSTANTWNSFDQSQSFTDSSDRRQSWTDSSDRRVDNSQSWADNSDRSVRQSWTDSSDRRQSWEDNSDRSVRQSWSDSSDRRVDASQSFEDRSDRSVRISTDGGAFDVVRQMGDQLGAMGRVQVDMARDMVSRASAASDEGLRLAFKAQEGAAGFNERAAAKSFDLAGDAQRFAQSSSDAALSFARGTYDQTLAMAQDVVKQAGANAAQAADTARGAYQSAADTASGNKTLIYVAIGAVVLVGGLVAWKA
jgi:hypothetical protein